MSLSPGHEPVEDDELLYRRIPVSMKWYDPATGVSPEAFDPHKDRDTTGISVFRAKHTSIERAAAGQGKKGYYVALLKAGDLLSAGIQVEPRPELDDPGHAELPQLTSTTRAHSSALELRQRLTSLVLRVEGPFPPQPSIAQ